MKNVLVVIDVQKEYITDDRPFHIKSISSSLENIRTILKKARQEQWEIVHIQHLQSSSLFNKDSALSDFITDFEPKQGEQHFIKSNFSCFSSNEFRSFIEKHKNDRLVIVGYGSSMCCLSTIIEGYHQGYNLLFIADASAAKKTDSFTEESVHAHMIEIMKSYSKIELTKNLFA